ncbi:fmp51p [Saccharomyces arboricola H-6]|uniref:MICOS complex subunit MIC12 n=1 Tax=Saccharomyces arboricola (strain H-6 / AS 2.3317 / CBS 10644) TaxID=1160507 RepID=J8QAV0_SACAR|nr:fmp51p [Saccharomyces arboricola H-6]
MSKLGSLARSVKWTLSVGAIGSVFYLYRFSNKGYFYNHDATWLKQDHQVQDLLDRKEGIPGVAKNSKQLVTDGGTAWTRTMGESMKDIWNEQIRSSVDWIYSWGKS